MMQRQLFSPRSALRNVTNNTQRIQLNFKHCSPSGTSENAKFNASEIKNSDFSIASLSGCSIVDETSAPVYRVPGKTDPRARPSYTDLLADDEEKSIDNTISNDSKFLHPGSIVRAPLTTLAGPQPKRARCEPTQSELKPKSNGLGRDNCQPNGVAPSNLSCDIVRISLRKRIRLEQLLAECRLIDYPLCALDGSPVERMMEVSDQIISIFAYEKLREAKPCYATVDFLSGVRRKQPCLTSDMLVTLADWVIDIHETFSLNHVTLHLAWALIYSYLGRGRSLHRREIQLFACAATMLASKYEERESPRLKELLYITDNAYVVNDLIRAERELLITIDFAVHHPNPYIFLRRFGRVLDAQNARVQYMARFLLEAGMHSHCISLQPASLKAAAVLWLARVVVRNPSYANWANQSDVLQLKHLIRAHPLSQAYYTREGEVTHVVTNQPTVSAESSPRNNCMQLLTKFYATTSGALDLTIPQASRQFSTNNNITRSMNGTPEELGSGTQSTFYSSVGCSSINAQSGAGSASSVPASTSHEEDQFAGLDGYTKSRIDLLRYEDTERRQFWPPILEHITSYAEVKIIPLAMRYHLIALRLVAEVARGGHLAEEATAAANAGMGSDAAGSGGEAFRQRCVSPGGHQLRRHAVSKYCSSLYLHVANDYPQLAFENFVPHFPFVQCKDDCRCFVCTNLIRTD